MKTELLNKSIDALIDELFVETVEKSDALNIAADSKTTADAVVNAAPKAVNDESRGAGRPESISTVPAVDTDGSRAGTFDSTIAEKQKEEENEEAKKQAKSVDQTTSTGRVAEAPSMTDPRLTKSITEEEYAEFIAFKKSQIEKAEQARFEELKKSEDLKKAEMESLIKSAVASAVSQIQSENQELKKSLQKSEELLKAIASQPSKSKSITGIEALEKSIGENTAPRTFSKAQKLDAAERLVMKKSLPMEVVVELENTGTVYNPEYKSLIEKELLNGR